MAHALRPNERIRSNNFQIVEGFCAANTPYDTAATMVNLITNRSAVGENLICTRTMHEAVGRDGTKAKVYLNELTDKILSGKGVVLDDTGKASIPSSIDNPRIINSTDSLTPFEITPDTVCPPGFSVCMPSNGTLEQDVLDRVVRFNEAQKDNRHTIKSPSLVEADPMKTAYICFDDVLVPRQKTVFKNGKEYVKTVRIHHSVVHISAFVPIDVAEGQQYEEKVCIFEAESQNGAAKMVLAFLLNNDLTDRCLVIFTDGEESLKTNLENVLDGWSYVFFLDWYHLREKCKEHFSAIFKYGKIVDPNCNPEYFKNGKVKKSSVKMITRSRYYLSEFLGILWAGNFADAVTYLTELKTQTSLLKAGAVSIIDNLIGYLSERKADRLTCFALRKFLGLKNSSNPVEKANDILVAKRQKNRGMAWENEGSFANSAVRMIFENQNVQSWYFNGRLEFALRRRASEVHSNERDITKWFSVQRDVIETTCITKATAA